MLEQRCHSVIPKPNLSYANLLVGLRRVSCASLRWTKYPSEEGEDWDTLSGWYMAASLLKRDFISRSVAV